MVVLYGRRRVGKTALTKEFARDKPALVFTAKIHWDAALAFIAQQAKDTHLV
ncbi:MAG: ATP-binding protein, partial [Coriobacteriaceae bacterium]